jgi:hypothetical protein
MKLAAIAAVFLSLRQLLVSSMAGWRQPVAAPAARRLGPSNRQVRCAADPGKVAVMTRELANHNRPTFQQLHPNVPKVAAGLVAWFVLMAWVFFDRQSLIGLPLAFVTVLFLVVGLLLGALSLVWYRHRPAHTRHPNKIPFRDWSVGDFAVWDGKLRGSEAAIQILLPIAAGAFGLTAIGIVFLICASAAS